MAASAAPTRRPGSPAPVDVLRRVAPFGALSRSVLAELRSHVDRLRVRAGTPLAHAGHAAHQVVVVVEGTVRLASAGATVDRAGPGAVIGATAVVARGPHLHDVVAETELDVVVVNGPAYRWVAPLIGPAAPGPAGGTGRPTAPTRPTPRRPPRGSRRSRTGW
jgi:hypothetical protein